MESLKRWREERWDRRADRARLDALAEAATLAAAGSAASSSPEGATVPNGQRRVRRDDLLRRSRSRKSISRWIRPWPPATFREIFRGPWSESSLNSPIHPVWDDDSGRRLTRSLLIALGANLILVPAVLIIMNFKFPVPSNTLRMKPYTVTFAAPKGNSLTGPRSPTPPQAAAPLVARTPPKVDPPKPVTPPRPNPPQVEPPAKKETQAPTEETRTRTAREKANDGKRVRETADPKETTPVPAKEKGNTKAGDGATRKAAPANPVEVPVTEPVARPGPLVASVAGPVVGTELSLGDLDGVNFPHSYYLEQIRDKIAQHWAPPEGMARGRQLKAVVTFRILRSGRIGEDVLEEPSGHAIFDQAAQRAVADAQKFGPLPEAFPGAFLVVHFNFTYTSP